jgi:hypothetical protein
MLSKLINQLSTKWGSGTSDGRVPHSIRPPNMLGCTSKAEIGVELAVGDRRGRGVKVLTDLRARVAFPGEPLSPVAALGV